MGASTGIEWADKTFNPWAGCAKVSPACANCYAEKSPGSVFRGVKWGPTAERVVSADSTWKQPLAWNRKAEREGTRPRVFCGSLCDVFEARDDLDEHRSRLWDLIEQTPNLIWLLLTKRPEEVMRRIPEDWHDRKCEACGVIDPEPEPLDDGDPGCPEEAMIFLDGWPSNVWIGCTVEDQQRADERIPHLLRIPAPVRFLSMEPLLSAVDLAYTCFNGADSFGSMPGISWVISGGESGPRARPSNPDWFRSLRDQCRGGGVPYFLKQADIGAGLEKMPMLDGKRWAEVPDVG